jgi:hypothetical protein
MSNMRLQLTLDFSQNSIRLFRLLTTHSVPDTHSTSVHCCIIQSFLLHHWLLQIIRLLGRSHKPSILLLHNRSCRIPNPSISFKRFCCLQHGLKPIRKAAQFTTKHGCMLVSRCIWLNVLAYTEVFSRPNIQPTTLKPTKTLAESFCELGLDASLLANCTFY